MFCSFHSRLSLGSATPDLFSKMSLMCFWGLLFKKAWSSSSPDSWAEVGAGGLTLLCSWGVTWVAVVLTAEPPEMTETWCEPLPMKESSFLRVLLFIMEVFEMTDLCLALELDRDLSTSRAWRYSLDSSSSWNSSSFGRTSFLGWKEPSPS